MVHEVSRVDAPPLVVLHVRNGFAQPQETAVGVDHQSVVGKLAVLGVVDPVSEFHSVEVGDEQSVVPLQK